MSVKFNVIERGKPGDPQAPKKFYPSIVATGKRSQREVAVSAAKLSALEPADMAAAVENFLSVITDELSRGNIVDLGEFGSFWLRVETEGADKQEDVNAASIQTVRMRFTPGKAFQEMLDKITFEKA
jgi:predicted histone-like DNA-binding protein